MEKELKIKTKDGKFIHGTFDTNKKSKGLIVFVHGFSGHQNEHVLFNGSKYFTNKGFDTFRFNFYSGEIEGSRQFRDTKISLYGKDINEVLNYFKKKYNNIYVIGHSYGGTSLLFIDQSLVKGLIFWDASYINSKDNMKWFKYNKSLNAYILNAGIEIVVGKSFVDELKNFPDCGELIKKINKPVLFVTAGRRGNSKAGIKYFEQASSPKKLINIETADHCFDKWEDEDSLFKNTYNWLIKIKKFI